jgi:hypothetical protein
VSPLTEAAAPVVETVMETSGPVLESAAETVSPLTEASAPLLEPVAGITGLVLEPVAKIAGPVLEPVAKIAGPVLEPVAEIGDPILEPVVGTAAPLTDALSLSTGAPSKTLSPMTNPTSDTVAPEPDAVAASGFSDGAETEASAPGDRAEQAPLLSAVRLSNPAPLHSFDSDHASIDGGQEGPGGEQAGLSWVTNGTQPTYSGSANTAEYLAALTALGFGLLAVWEAALLLREFLFYSNVKYLLAEPPR